MRLSRREFLKLAGLASSAAATIGHWSVFGRAADSFSLPNFTEDGEFVTTCSVCPLGCGLIVSIRGGKIVRVDTNIEHPLGVIAENCSLRRQPLSSQFPQARLSGPHKRDHKGKLKSIGWDAAIEAVKSAWQVYKPSEIGFLVGVFPDSVFDFVTLIASALGGANVFRYSAYSELSGWVTLIDAAKKLYGMSQVPFFDLSKTDLIFSFGGDPFEKWRLAAKENATWVTFSPYCFSNLSGADEWVAIRPGSEALVAGALANLITEILGKDAEDTIPAVDVVLAAQTAGLKVATLRRFATMFAYSSRKVAIPGAAVLGQTGGLAAAEAVLALNGVVGNLGTEGGLFLKPEILASQARMKRPSTFAEVKSLIERIRSGQVKALFLHGVDPLNELPPHMGLEKALDKLEVMFSFAPSIDRTAHRADYILPDRATIESWGYNRLPPVSDRPGLSIWRPLASRGEENRAAVDVLLAAAQASGGELIDAAAYKNEADFVQKSCLAQVGLGDRTSADFEHWSYRGGWWPQEQLVMPPVSVGSVSYDGISPGLGDKKGNDTAILMSPYVSYEQGGNQFVALNSLTARRLNLCEGQTVLVESAFGQIIVDVKVLDDILDGVAVVPLSLQRASKPNAWRLLGELENVSGNLAYCQLPITIT